jgi:hypothetical protein
MVFESLRYRQQSNSSSAAPHVRLGRHSDGAARARGSHRIRAPRRSPTRGQTPLLRKLTRVTDEAAAISTLRCGARTDYESVWRLCAEHCLDHPLLHLGGRETARAVGVHRCGEERMGGRSLAGAGLKPSGNCAPTSLTSGGRKGRRPPVPCEAGDSWRQPAERPGRPDLGSEP